ncbi:hypothetical protein GCM10009817_39840 [Terrabacter lapilli]|uniref:DUF4129 domain-containing protein n=1 Tax=Terrabacter lapilli TaxID=436231 RepID=A0ABN2SWT1_9MICO
MSSAFSFSQQVLLNLVGPALTIVVGTVAVGGLVSWLQRRRESRLDRQNLTVEMFQIAYGFYIPVEDARRRVRYGTPEPASEVLDSAFQEFRVAGRTIEARLRVPEQGDEQVTSRWVWHCVLDLLTLLYFHQRYPGQRTTDLIAGQVKEHAVTNTRENVPEVLIQKYLRPEGLDQADEVKRRFAQALDELIALRR